MLEATKDLMLLVKCRNFSDMAFNKTREPKAVLFCHISAKELLLKTEIINKNLMAEFGTPSAAQHDDKKTKKIDTNHEIHDVIKGFHNQKTPDFNPETNVLYGAGEKGHIKHHLYEESIARIKTIGETVELEDLIAKSVLILNNINLNQESSDDEDQIKLLEKRKKFAMSKISSLLEDVNHYVISINALDTVKQQRDDINQEDYLAQLERADRYRKQRHDSLIQSLHSTIKYIQYNFGKINEKALEKWEEEQEEKGFPILDVRRVEFPPKVVCPESIDLNNRKHITAWAVQLALSLGQLKKRLTQEHASL